MVKKSTKVLKEVEEIVESVTEAIGSVDPSLIQVWDRRLLNPLQAGITSIEIKDDGYELRWINTAQQGRFYNATREQGWTKVHPDELVGTPKDLGLDDLGDGMVRRGIKGEEILMKMPKAVFSRIQRRKSEMVVKALKNTRQNLAQSAANRFGGQAGEFVMGKGTEEVGGLTGDLTGSIGKLDV